VTDPRRQTRFLIDQFRMGNALGLLTYRLRGLKQTAKKPITTTGAKKTTTTTGVTSTTENTTTVTDAFTQDEKGRNISNPKHYSLSGKTSEQDE